MMGRNIERFKKACKEKGVFTGLTKTISYLLFVARKNRLEKIWKGARLKLGRIEIRGWNTGPRLYWDGLELTKGIGLNASIFANGKWHDSSKAYWRTADVRADSLTLRNNWRSLPIKQTWIISNIRNERFACEIILDVQKDVEFIEEKFTLMLSERFNIWSNDTNRLVRFPKCKDWEDIKEVNRKSDFISAQSDIDKDLPRIVVRKQDAQQRIYPQIQNSDFKTNARLLNFVRLSRDTDLKHKKGISPFFKIEIDVR